MSKIILVTGGSRSGKSTFGENYLKTADDVLYIATAKRIDGEMELRILHHQARRSQKWETFEGYRGLAKAVEGTSREYILLDCVTNMISNLMFDLSQNMEDMSQAETDLSFVRIKDEFSSLLEAVRSASKTLVMVTNEVGMGLISEYKLGRDFVDFSGFINQFLAKEADEVYFMVAGLPMRLK